MYQYLFLCLFFITLAMQSFGQKSEGGRPYSDLIPVMKSTNNLPEVILKSINIGQLIQDEEDNPVPPRYGIFTDTLIHIKSEGRMDIIPGKGKIWRMKISNSNARSIQVYFSKFIIPSGASLFLYDDNKRRLSGAFTQKNMQPDSEFMIADFKGDHVVVEYFEPEHSAFPGEVIVGSVGQSYRDVLQSESGPEDFININCPIGKNAQLAKHAVAKMAFRSGQFQVTCSGALINNTKNDGTPLFLTANHCLSTQAEAGTLITYFNYEVVGCDGDTLVPLVLSGSTLLSTGQQSDYTLLRLNEVPSPEHQPYYAGWDVSDLATDSVTAVHVPFGNTKKISLDYDSIYSNPVSVTWDDDSRSPRGSHWVIGFDEGGTSQGSSGSPVFNASNQIIGQLHGGDDQMAFYGKLSYSYENKPAAYPLIATFLDPDSSGVTSLAGYAPADNIPDAFFTTGFEQVCLNAPIVFTDYSVFGPFERNWVITPETYNFLDGTSETSVNPVIQFLQDTTYTVRLELSSENMVKSSESMSIISGEEINVSFRSFSPAEFCDCDFEKIKITGIGAENYTWSVLPEGQDKVGLTQSSGDTTTLYSLPGYKATGNYTVSFLLTGSQSTCTDTIIGTYTLLKPINDEIENAILLDYGMSEYYSNICASVQDGEPIPPHSSCTSQLSWCDEYGTGVDIVENSVWFKFVASSTGRVSISSTGMDNEIALYSARNEQDILNNNYQILGANDDRSDADFRPLIASELVTPGKTYWIQVDGSGGGLEDLFYLTITELSITPTEETLSQNMVVYPQPATSHVIISNSEWTEPEADLLVFSSAGICILNQKTSLNSHQFFINTESWDSGIYIAAIFTGNKKFIARIVKK